MADRSHTDKLPFMSNNNELFVYHNDHYSCKVGENNIVSINTQPHTTKNHTTALLMTQISKPHPLDKAHVLLSALYKVRIFTICTVLI